MIEKTLPTYDLTKLRRFALLMGLILLAISLAGVSIKNEFSTSFLRLEVRNPDNIFLFIILTSIFSCSLYFYYAFWIETSPRKARKHIRKYGLMVLQPLDPPSGETKDKDFEFPYYLSKFVRDREDHIILKEMCDALPSEILKLLTIPYVGKFDFDVRIKELARQRLEQFFPGIKQDELDLNDDFLTLDVLIIKIKEVGPKTKFLNFIENRNYEFPIWVNLFAWLASPCYFLV